MQKQNPFYNEVKKFNNSRILEIIESRDSYSDNLHSACISEAYERNIQIEHIDIENILPYSEIEELKEIKNELNKGLTEENILNYLQVSGLSIADAKLKVKLAKKITSIPKQRPIEPELEPDYGKRFLNFILILITIITTIVLLINLWMRFGKYF